MAYRRKDGRMVEKITVKGKRVSFYSNEPNDKKAMQEIQRKILEYTGELERGKRFNEVSDEWASEHLEKLTYNTASRYKCHIEYAKDFFKNADITKITANHIKNLMQSRIKKGYAGKTVKNQMSVVKMIFEYACINGYLEQSPCLFLRVPANLPKTKREIPTTEEIEIINNSYDDGIFGLLAYFVLYSGLRKGETLALTYNDIDFKNKRIYVTKAVYFVGNTPHIKAPKTEAGTRVVPLLDCLAEKLNKNAIGLIFHDSNGSLMRNGYFTKHWKKFCESKGIHVGLHQLRHAYASYILHDTGIDVKTAQEIMGHADIQTTQNIYTQLTEAKLNQATEKLNNAFKGSKRGQIR